jgi:hypothetical protein
VSSARELARASQSIHSQPHGEPSAWTMTISFGVPNIEVGKSGGALIKKPNLVDRASPLVRNEYIKRLLLSFSP